MNNTTKQVLPVGTGSDAEAYLQSVRAQAEKLGPGFSSARHKLRGPVFQGPGETANFSSGDVGIYQIYKKCALVFPNLPSRCPDSGSFWRLASQVVSQLPSTDLEISGKEGWKMYIKDHEPLKLAHKDVFDAIKVLCKMHSPTYSPHLEAWGWCLLLQVPALVTGQEMGVLRTFAQLYNDKFWKAVLASCFGQTDMASTALDY